jgi:hypothetical protein
MVLNGETNLLVTKRQIWKQMHIYVKFVNNQMTYTEDTLCSIVLDGRACQDTSGIMADYVDN